MMLHDRSDASLELQHRNIGAALEGLREEWTPEKTGPSALRGQHLPGDVFAR